MQVYKETIWHFTCKACTGFWSIAASDNWVPTELFCPHCSSKRTYSKELTEQVDDNDYLPERNDSQHENYYEFEDEFGDIEALKKSIIEADPDIEYTDEWCSCGHRKIDCNCKSGCKCGCNKRFLRAY